MPHTSDTELIQQTHNTARYFVEHRQIAWAALLGVIGWGVFGYFSMPQRKDPEIPVRVAVAACQWPGATAQEVEQLITRPIEQTIAQNKTIHPAGPDDYGIRSISLPGASFVYVQLSEDTKNSREQFSDINLKLQGLGPQLPSGATGVQFQSDFGDTAALMMTVASPPIDDLEVEMRARSVEDAIRAARSAAGRSKLQPVSIIYTFPLSLSETALTQATEGFRRSAERDSLIEQGKLVAGRGFIGVDGLTKYDDKDLAAYLERYVSRNFQESEIDPDISARVIIRGVEQTREKLATAAGLKYSYAQLDNYTDLISRSLLGVPQTSRVERKGVLPQAVYLEYSQERLASYGVQVADLGRVLLARNITLPGGSIEAGGREVQIDPSGRFEDARSIGSVSKPAELSEFLFLVRQERPVSPQPRHHARRLHAVRRTNSEIRRRRRREDEAGARRSASGSGHRANVRSAPASEREYRSVHGSPVRSHRAGRVDCTDRVLGMALGAADGAVDADYARDDGRHGAHGEYRLAAGFDRDADHCARFAGRQSRGCK